jgi:hypothetical protein
MTDDTDTPRRPRFHGFLFYLFIVNVVALLLMGTFRLIEAAQASLTTCGSDPSPAWRVTGRVPCPYTVVDPWKPVAEPEPVVEPEPVEPTTRWKAIEESALPPCRPGVRLPWKCGPMGLERVKFEY